MIHLSSHFVRHPKREAHGGLHAFNDSGQVTIFVALSIPFIAMLFLAVIYVSLMVNAKINLQNAADLAAMAGAAEQARVMTMIGIKNYELKKNVKEFAFYINIVHNWESDDYFNRDLPPSFCAVDSLVGHTDDTREELSSFGTTHPCEKLIRIESARRPSTAIEPPQWVNYFNSALIPINIVLHQIVFDPNDGAIAQTCEKFALANIAHLKGGNIPGNPQQDKGDLNIFYNTADYIKRQIETLSTSLNNCQSIDRECQDVFNDPSIGDQNTKNLILVKIPKPQNPNAIAYKTARKNLSNAHLGTDDRRFFAHYNSGIHYRTLAQNFGFWVTRFTIDVDGLGTYCVANPSPNPNVQPNVNLNSPGVQVNFDPDDWEDFDGWAFVVKMPIGITQTPENTQEYKPTFYAVRLETDVKLPAPLNILPRKIIAYAAAKPFGAKLGLSSSELELDQRSYNPGVITYPNFTFQDLGNGGYDTVQVKQFFRNKFYEKYFGSTQVQNDTAKRNARHDDLEQFGRGWTAMRKWARAPKSNEIGNYVFNLSMSNPNNPPNNQVGEAILTQNGGLDFLDFKSGNNFIQTVSENPNDLLNKLMQVQYRGPAGNSENRNGYSVKLISFDEIGDFLPANSEWKIKTGKIHH